MTFHRRLLSFAAIFLVALATVSALAQTNTSLTGLGFNGTNQSGTFSVSVTNDFTIEFWIKTTQTDGNPSSAWYNGIGLVDATALSRGIGQTNDHEFCQTLRNINFNLNQCAL